MSIEVFRKQFFKVLKQKDKPKTKSKVDNKQLRLL